MGILSKLFRLAELENEELTHYKATISSDHAYIHKGMAFTYAGNTGVLAAGATYALSFTTPTFKTIHLRPTGFYSTANAMELRIAEGSTVTGGSSGVAINRNRDLKRPSKVLIGYGVTISAEGTILDYEYAGSQGAGANRNGGSGVPADEEIVLAKNTIYSVRIENIGATTASTGYYKLFWYEEK
jgi:hypothetical protein